MRKIAIITGVVSIVVVVLIIVGLYQLGAADESALERLHEIAVIFAVLLFLIVVILLAAITAALGFLVIQIKDHVIPLLQEAAGTVKQVKNTTSFVSEEAVRPIVGVAGWFSKNREMTRVVTGRSKKIPNPDKL